MGMGFGKIDEDVDGQMTLDGLMREAAKSAAREEVSAVLQEDRGDDRIDRAKRDAKEHTDELRAELGSLTKLKPLERYALLQLARALANGVNNKKTIKKRIERLMK